MRCHSLKANNGNAHYLVNPRDDGRESPRRSCNEGREARPRDRRCSALPTQPTDLQLKERARRAEPSESPLGARGHPSGGQRMAGLILRLIFRTGVLLHMVSLASKKEAINHNDLTTIFTLNCIVKHVHTYILHNHSYRSVINYCTHHVHQYSEYNKHDLEARTLLQVDRGCHYGQ